MIKIIKVLVVLLMFSGLGGSGYLWHQKGILEDTIAGLQDDVESEKKASAYAQKKIYPGKGETGHLHAGKISRGEQKGQADGGSKGGSG